VQRYKNYKLKTPIRPNISADQKAQILLKSNIVDPCSLFKKWLLFMQRLYIKLRTNA